MIGLALQVGTGIFFPDVNSGFLHIIGTLTMGSNFLSEPQFQWSIQSGLGLLPHTACRRGVHSQLDAEDGRSNAVFEIQHRLFHWTARGSGDICLRQGKKLVVVLLHRDHCCFVF